MSEEAEATGAPVPADLDEPVLDIFLAEFDAADMADADLSGVLAKADPRRRWPGGRQDLGLAEPGFRWRKAAWTGHSGCVSATQPKPRRQDKDVRRRGRDRRGVQRKASLRREPENPPDDGLDEPVGHPAQGRRDVQHV